MDHWVVFDQAGQLASSVTYLHVALPVNITTLKVQSHIIASILLNLTKSSDLDLSPAKQTVNKIIKDISLQLLYKLDRTMDRLNVIQTLLPQDKDSSSRQRRSPLCITINEFDKLSCKIFGFALNEITINPLFANLTGTLDFNRFLQDSNYQSKWETKFKNQLLTHNISKFNRTKRNAKPNHPFYFFELFLRDITGTKNSTKTLWKRDAEPLLPIFAGPFIKHLAEFYLNSTLQRTKRSPFVFLAPFVVYKLKYDKAVKNITLLLKENSQLTVANKEIDRRLHNVLLEMMELQQLPEMPSTDTFLPVDLQNIPNQREGTQNLTFSNLNSNSSSSGSFSKELRNIPLSLTDGPLTTLLNTLRLTKRRILSKEFSEIDKTKKMIISKTKTNHSECFDRVFATIMSTLQSIDVGLINLVDVTPSLNSSCKNIHLNLHLNKAFKVRQKRMLAEILITAGVSGLIGTFMGIYSAAEIGKIKSQLAQMKEQQQLLVQITSQHDQQIQQLVSDLTRLTSVVEALIKYNPTVFYAQLEEQIDLLDSRISDTIDVIQQLQNHRLSVKLLSADQIKAMRSEIEMQATHQHLKPLPTKITDYFQLETTYVREGDNLLLLVHVPCVPDSHVLKIFRYIPFPIPLPKPSFIHPHSIEHALFNSSFSNSDVQAIQGQNKDHPSHQEGLLVTPEAELIAIGVDQKYKILSTAELDGCDRKPRVFLCNQHQVLRTNLEESCLGSLYLRSEEGVRMNCQVKRVPLRETVHQLSSSTFLVFSPTDFTRQGKCLNGTQFPIAITVGNNEVHIPPGCQVTLNSHELLSDMNIRINSETLSRIWHWSPLSLPFSSLHDPGRADPHIAELHRSLIQLQHDSNQTHRLTHQLSDPSTLPSSWWIIIVAIAAFSTMVILCYLWHCTRTCQGCKNFVQICRSKPSTPAPAAHTFALQHLPTNARSPMPVVCAHAKPLGLCCPKY